jgi:hypothetical protein
MVEEFQLFNPPQLTSEITYDQLTEVYLEATTWQGLASIELMKRHKATLEAKLNLVNAKREGIEERIQDSKASLYNIMIYETNLQIASGKVDLFTDFIDENIPDISGEAARRRVANYRELIPLYYNVLSSIE